MKGAGKVGRAQASDWLHIHKTKELVERNFVLWEGPDADFPLTIQSRQGLSFVGHMT